MRICLIPTFTLWLASCASLSAQLPPAQASAVQAEQTLQSRAAFELYMAENTRLQNIAADILRANAPLCERRHADIGVQTARLKDLPEDLRPIAKAEYGIGDSAQVIYARSGSGIALGDVLLSQGKPAKLNAANFDPKGVTVERAGEALDIDLSSELACHYPVTLRYTPAINAYATGRSIIVTTGMMKFATDDEVALIIGHELAHNTQSHIRKIIQNRILALGFGTFTRQFESEADYVGLYYMARAGYAIDAAAQFWRRLATVSVKSLNTPKSHPITPERYVRLEGAITEINAKRETGAPLIPNQATP